MINFKKLTIWTIAAYFFILIGAGHGLAFIGLIELAGLFYLEIPHVSFSPIVSYKDSLPAAAIFGFIGQLLLIFSIIIEAEKAIFILKFSGLIILWIGYYYLAHNLFKDGVAMFSFVTGVPFLVCSMRLAVGILKNKEA